MTHDELRDQPWTLCGQPAVVYFRPDTDGVPLVVIGLRRAPYLESAITEKVAIKLANAKQTDLCAEWKVVSRG